MILGSNVGPGMSQGLGLASTSGADDSHGEHSLEEGGIEVSANSGQCCVCSDQVLTRNFMLERTFLAVLCDFNLLVPRTAHTRTLTKKLRK